MKCRVRKTKASENPIILAEIMKKHGFEDTVSLHLQWTLRLKTVLN